MTDGADDAEEKQLARPWLQAPRALVAFGRALLTRHRILRFLVVGGINTLVGYALFLLALAIFPTTFIALCVSTVFAILFNFLSTGTYVFGSRDPRRLAHFFAVYALVFAYNAIGLALFEAIGVGPRVGALLLLPGAVIGSYLLNRSFVFGASR